VPEILFILMPVMFPTEPYLSQAWQFMLIPISWPLALYYITHLWSLFILVLAIEKMLDVTRGKAFGTAMLVAIPYFITNYLVLNPILGTPGFRIEFTSISSQMILFISSIALSVAAFLGAFKKE
jgi:ABC-type transport system involved in cytochrome c biogenesis permease subunit